MLKFSRDFKIILKEKKITEKQFVKYCDDSMVKISKLTTEVDCIRTLNKLTDRKSRLGENMVKLNNLFLSFNPNSDSFKDIKLDKDYHKTQVSKVLKRTKRQKAFDKRANKYINSLYKKGYSINKTITSKKCMNIYSLNENFLVVKLNVNNNNVIDIDKWKYICKASNLKKAIKKFRGDTNPGYIDLFDYSNMDHSRLHTAINKAIINTDTELETRVENDFDDLLKKSMLKYFGENLDNEINLQYTENKITKDIMIQFSVSISHWDNEPENIDVFDIVMLFGEEELPLKPKRLRKIEKSIQQSVNLI